MREYEFDRAWNLAMRSLPRGRTPEQREYLMEWKDALRWAKSNFRTAYEKDFGNEREPAAARAAA